MMKHYFLTMIFFLVLGSAFAQEPTVQFDIKFIKIFHSYKDMLDAIGADPLKGQNEINEENFQKFQPDDMKTISFMKMNESIWNDQKNKIVVIELTFKDINFKAKSNQAHATFLPIVGIRSKVTGRINGRNTYSILNVSGEKSYLSKDGHSIYVAQVLMPYQWEKIDGFKYTGKVSIKYPWENFDSTKSSQENKLMKVQNIKVGQTLQVNDQSSIFSRIIKASDAKLFVMANQFKEDKKGIFHSNFSHLPKSIQKQIELRNQKIFVIEVSSRNRDLDQIRLISPNLKSNGRGKKLSHGSHVYNLYPINEEFLTYDLEIINKNGKMNLLKLHPNNKIEKNGLTINSSFTNEYEYNLKRQKEHEIGVKEGDLLMYLARLDPYVLTPKDKDTNILELTYLQNSGLKVRTYPFERIKITGTDAPAHPFLNAVKYNFVHENRMWQALKQFFSFKTNIPESINVEYEQNEDDKDKGTVIQKDFLMNITI